MYIGKTKQTLRQRKAEHKSKANSALYKPIQKYGIENFTFETIDFALDSKRAAELEEHWILYYKSHCKSIGYNKAIGEKRYGSVNGFFGKHHEEKTIEGNILHQKTRCPVLCITTGETYPSVRTCERETGIPRGVIRRSCKGVKTFAALKFQYI
jgi:hypothetical protein